MSFLNDTQKSTGTSSRVHHLSYHSSPGSTAKPNIRLRPVLPSYPDKYAGLSGGGNGVQYSRLVPAVSLDPGSHRSEYETQLGWTTYTHPDGSTYSWHKDLKIVTFSDPLQGGLDQILRAAKAKIEELSRSQNANIDSAETYMSAIRAQADVVDVDYYMINHQKSVPFWVQQADIMTQPYGSKEQLYLALKSEYWTHLENFPAQRSVTEALVDELADALIHSGTDDLTSQGSLSPWGAAECFHHLEFVKELKGKEPSPYRTATVARLWGTISRVRLLNRHGLPGPRLDRFQGLESFITEQLRPSFALTLVETLSFNMPKRTFHRLSELWNGRLVYIRHWDTFLAEYRETWIRTAFLSGGILSLGTLLLASKPRNDGMLAAVSLASLSMLMSIYLHERHSKSRLGTATDISSYLSRSEDIRHGLRPLSVLLSLPQALTAWAAILFQIGLLLLVISSNDSTVEWGGLLPWIAPPIVVSMVFLTAGGSGV